MTAPFARSLLGWKSSTKNKLRWSLVPNFADVVRLAGLSQGCLARFASTRYKDPRAPQNLYPISGLERELRRRLGDPRLLYRALSRSAAA